MATIRLGAMVALILLMVGCGGYGSNYNGGGGGAGAPSITQLVPGDVTAGGAAFTLTVNGTGFGTDSVVYWATTPQTSMYVTGKQVTAQIPATDIANVGTVSIYVRSGGHNSNSMDFTVQ
jgi:IPT/TIG domain